MLNTLRYIWNHPLARRDRAGALADWLRWQVGSRILGAPVVVPFVGDTVLAVRTGMAGATGNIYVGLHELDTMGFLLHFLRPDERFADVGANVGSFSVLAGGAVGARVIAFEPIAAAFEVLERNVRLNGFSARAELHQAAVGAASGRVSFTCDRDTTNRVADSVTDARATVDVDVVTLDDVVGADVPRLVKIDVEGYEREVIDGAASILSSPACEALIIELIGIGEGRGADEGALVDRVIAHGFTAARYEPVTRRLDPLPTSPRPRGNVIFVRDVARARERVASAPRFRVKRTHL